ncbi:hypothetical protein HYS92_03220 [Candidatus Daviesbacteria bacterium]|nr:hypothetical protein [Candidatus Daviesbacteria bacterium]
MHPKQDSFSLNSNAVNTIQPVKKNKNNPLLIILLLIILLILLGGFILYFYEFKYKPDASSNLLNKIHTIRTVKINHIIKTQNGAKLEISIKGRALNPLSIDNNTSIYEVTDKGISNAKLENLAIGQEINIVTGSPKSDSEWKIQKVYILKETQMQ